MAGCYHYRESDGKMVVSIGDKICKKLSFAVISTLDKWDIFWFGSTIFEQNVKKNYLVAKVLFAQIFVTIPSDK